MLTASPRSRERTRVAPRTPRPVQPGGMPRLKPERRLTTRRQPRGSGGRRSADALRAGAVAAVFPPPEPPQPADSAATPIATMTERITPVMATALGRGRPGFGNPEARPARAPGGEAWVARSGAGGALPAPPR